jgi:hypothetical protein
LPDAISTHTAAPSPTHGGLVPPFTATIDGYHCAQEQAWPSSFDCTILRNFVQRDEESERKVSQKRREEEDGEKPSKGEREEGRRSYRKKEEIKCEGERESLFNKLKE